MIWFLVWFAGAAVSFCYFWHDAEPGDLAIEWIFAACTWPLVWLVRLGKWLAS